MSVAIPKMGQYDLKPSAVKAKRYQRVIPSLGNNPNTGYSVSASPDTIIFYLPCGLSNQVMDGQSATLKFTVASLWTSSATVAANAETFELDGTASCFISRIDIYGAGGSLCESVSSYGVLSSIFHDIFYTNSDLDGLSAQIGSHNITNIDGDAPRYVARHGAEIGCPAITGASTGYTYKTYSIPILSSLFQFSEKYLPVWAMNSDIRIEVILNTLTNSVCTPAQQVSASVALTSINLLNPEIIVDYIEIDETAMGAIKSSYAGRDLVVHSTTLHNYQTTITSGTSSNFNTILPSKVMSAKYALFTFRQTGVLTQTDYTLSIRSNPFITAGSNFNLNIGGMRVPQRPITTSVASDVSAYFASTQNAFHAMGALLANGSLDNTSYTSSQALITTNTSNFNNNDPYAYGFVIGVNLDSFVRQSETMLSGTDLSKITTYIEANFGTATTALYTLDTFVCHDVLLIIDANGSLTAKF